MLILMFSHEHGLDLSYWVSMRIKLGQLVTTRIYALSGNMLCQLVAIPFRLPGSLYPGMSTSPSVLRRTSGKHIEIL